ncbi:MAG: (Fe-S)-binding protein, partial [Patescibacteria group bacterium]|nr:(Fe-S)-binding protein [Patescibacteria group bacterium]
IGGPAMPGEETACRRRSEVLQYAAGHPGQVPEEGRTYVLPARFTPSRADAEPISEEQIRHVLEGTGKAAEVDQLNCGACGYPTCREKAIAVIRGLAEADMCMPYVRRLAEQRVDQIIDTSPNGIVILDDQLRILSMNPAFRRMFMCSDAVSGRPISYLLDPEPFERLATDPTQLCEATVEYPNYHLTCHQILYALADEGQYVGIFVNNTRMQTSERQLDELRVQTVLQARELLDQQTTMAETIAVCLGENAARSEALLDKLMLLAKGEKEGQGGASQASKQWLRDTYTSK